MSNMNHDRVMIVIDIGETAESDERDEVRPAFEGVAKSGKLPRIARFERTHNDVDFTWEFCASTLSRKPCMRRLLEANKRSPKCGTLVELFAILKCAIRRFGICYCSNIPIFRFLVCVRKNRLRSEARPAAKLLLTSASGPVSLQVAIEIERCI